MIVTFTPNPSIDRAITIDALHRGQVHRASSSRIDPGGKGVNVSRALAAQGAPTVAVYPSGGPEGHLMGELLEAAGVPFAAVPVQGTLRMNISVLEPDGTTTKLNEPGPSVTAADLDRILDTVLESAKSASWVVGSGSLPPGMPDDIYSTLVNRCRAAGVRCAIDSSGSPLVATIPARPHLIKPNHEELAELVGSPLRTLGDVRDAARELVADGLEIVVVSLGKYGALAVDADSVTHADTQVPAIVSTVAAGDCLLAGLLYALSSGASTAEAVRVGTMFGAAAASLPGSEVPTPDYLSTLTGVITPDPDFTLSLS